VVGRTGGDAASAAAADAAPYRPPCPRPMGALPSLVRALARGGDLLSLLPAAAYRMPIGPLGWSRRSTVVVNAPELTRRLMTDDLDLFPKSDLMVGALEPLIGDSIFVSSGGTWRRQRRMIDPAFSHIRINRAFAAMTAAVDDHEEHLAAAARRGEAVSLDLAMSHLAADIITRTVFSTPLADAVARDVFDAFGVFEKSVAEVEIFRLIFDPAWKKVPQKPHVLEACARIRRHLGDLVDERLAPGACPRADIADALVAARDPETGRGFGREELIDQLGVFFLAGHETTASALTWCFYVLASRPPVLARLRAEVDAVCGDGPVGFEAAKRLDYARAVFRETLRLYPPITFLPRVALETARVGPRTVRRGALVMIAPWTIHRHRLYWRDPEVFDPDRFSPEREGEVVPGAYLPFGQGPRICAGAAFATVESVLILARLARRFDFEVADPGAVRPAARLTTRPERQITVRVRDRRA
jgi:cytochrome P450